jgi:outer membrane protein assembly factor BamD
VVPGARLFDAIVGPDERRWRSETETNNMRLFLVAVAAIFLLGCPSVWEGKVVKKNLPPEDQFKAAERSLQQKDYAAAVERFERLKSGSPDFKKMPEVYFKIAESLQAQGLYDKAIARYRNFVELYPHHKDVPKAKYNIALSYFKQIKSTDLDNRIVTRAAEAFKAVADNPEGGPWAKKAQEKYKECLKDLAAKEIYKAETYVSMGRYKAARLSAQRVLEQYPKLGYDERAKALIKKYKGK